MYLEDCCKMTEWGSHYLFPFFTADHGLPVFSGNLFFYDPRSLSRALCLFNSAPTTLRPESVRSLSFPCTSTTPPLLPLPWVCNRVKSNRGVWALGGRVETRSCTSTIYLLHLLACLLFIPYHLRNTNSLYCVRLPFAGTFLFYLFLFKNYLTFFFFLLFGSLSLSLFCLFLPSVFLVLYTTPECIYYKDTGQEQEQEQSLL